MLTQLSHFKCKLKSEYFFEILVTYSVPISLINILKYLVKRQKKRIKEGPIESVCILALKRIKNLKKYIVHAMNNLAGFYKSHWYGYNFVDLVQMNLKIYFLLQSDSPFGKYRDFWVLPLISVLYQIFQIGNISWWIYQTIQKIYIFRISIL